MKIPYEKRQKIRELWKLNLNSEDISDETGINESTIRVYISAYNSGCNSIREYLNKLAKDKGYKSAYDQEKKRSMQFHKKTPYEKKKERNERRKRLKAMKSLEELSDSALFGVLMFMKII